MDLCVVWGCRGHVILLALFMEFQWSVNISLRMGILEEQDDTVVCVF